MTRSLLSSSRRGFLKTTALASAALAAPSIGAARENVTLRFSSWLSPQSPVTQNLFHVWRDEVEAMTDGRVTFDMGEGPLGPPPAHHELVTSGGADVGYSLHGYSPNHFLRSNIGQFSFLGDAYSASHAFSKVYTQLLKGEQEHESMRMLGVFQHGPGFLMLKDKVIAGPEDYQGLRIRTSGGYIGQLIEDLGGTNVPMSPTAVRQAFIDGTIEGVAFPYEGARAFNVDDQITFISELPDGYFNATWFLGMSEQAAGRLSDRDHEMVTQYSAETVHVLAAKAFDYADYMGKEALIASGIPIVPTSNEVTDHIKTIGEVYEQAWAAELAADGFDGERALAFTRRITSGG